MAILQNSHGTKNVSLDPAERFRRIKQRIKWIETLSTIEAQLSPKYNKDKDKKTIIIHWKKIHKRKEQSSERAPHSNWKPFHIKTSFPSLRESPNVSALMKQIKRTPTSFLRKSMESKPSNTPTKRKILLSKRGSEQHQHLRWANETPYSNLIQSRNY